MLKARILPLFLKPLSVIALIGLMAFSDAAFAQPLSIFQRAKEHIDWTYHSSDLETRDRLHSRITIEDSDLPHKPSVAFPRLIFVGGGYAVGKSTIISELRRQGIFNLDDYVLVDMDVLRAQLPEFQAMARQNPERAAELTNKEAGYLYEILTWASVLQKKNLLLTGSLRSSEFMVTLMQKIQEVEPAYKGRMHFVYVKSNWPQVLTNVEYRNRNSSRFTQIEDVKRSFEESKDRAERLKRIFHSTLTVDSASGRFQIVEYVRNSFSYGLNIGIEELVAAQPKDMDQYFLSQVFSRPQPGSGYDIVLDLDWTLFYNIQDPTTVPEKELIVYKVGNRNEYYRASDGAAEFIEDLLAFGDIRLHIFSGGSEERNRFLLSQIRLSDGRAALDVVKNVFSNQHLTRVSSRDDVHFTEKFKKIIQGLLPFADMSRTLLLDDQTEFAADGLKVIESYGDFNFSQQFDPRRVGEEFYPSSELEWKRERQKLTLAFNVIQQARVMDRANLGVFAHMADIMLKDEKGNWLKIGDPRLENLFSRKHAMSNCIRALSKRLGVFKPNGRSSDRAL